MSDTAELLKNEINAKVALALVESLTADKILALVKDELDKKDGYYSKPFLQTLLSDIIRDSIRDEVTKQINENISIINEAVKKAVSVNLIQKLANNIEVKLSDSLNVIIKESRDDD